MESLSDRYELGRNGSRVRGLKENTIAEHLCRLAQAGEAIEVGRFIPKEKIKTIQDTIRKTNSSSLKVIKDTLSALSDWVIAGRIDWK